MEKYEIQIAGLKKNLDFVMEENAYYKRALDNQAQTNEKDAEYEIEFIEFYLLFIDLSHLNCKKLGF